MSSSSTSSYPDKKDSTHPPSLTSTPPEHFHVCTGKATMTTAITTPTSTSTNTMAPHVTIDLPRKKYADAKAAAKSYTDGFLDLAPPISATEVRSLPPDAVVLVDVRTPEERSVSMLPGALAQEDFERRKEEYRARPEVTIVPYCTMGRRSGLYARKLVKEGGFLKEKVRNGEGILLWTHEGRREEGREGGSLVGPDGQATYCVHAYGQAWAPFAEEGFEVVVFPNTNRNPFQWLTRAWTGFVQRRRRGREMKQEDKGEEE